MTPSSQRALALLADLATLGISIRADGAALRVGPVAKITPDIAQRLKGLKPEVLAVLRAQTSQAESVAAARLDQPGYRRFAVAREELRRRGFHILADKPEFVLAVLAAVEVLVEEKGAGSNE